MTFWTSRVGLRLALVYSTLFFAYGIHLPFWPLWLQTRGLSATEIAWIVAIGPWSQVLVNPWVGRRADRTQRLRLTASVLSLGVVASYAALSWSETTAVIVGFAVVLGVSFSPLVPLTDASTLRNSRGVALEYGKIRRFGSAAFIGGSLVGGAWMRRAGADSIIVLLVLATAAAAISTFALPCDRAESRPAGVTGSASSARRHELALFLGAAGALWGSHSMLYALGSPVWLSQGIGERQIGALWAIGVVAEIVLFSVGRRLRGLSAASLLGLASIGGLIRWPLLASTTTFGWLVLGQVLHGLTFGALHLGAMAYVQARVDPQRNASAMTSYAAVGGLGLGLGMPLVGQLFEFLDTNTYLVMAVVSSAGGIFALGLARAIGKSERAPPG